MKNYREQNINDKNLKRPTDIIIFTDSFSYSATSTFITSFQNTGGAIVVGYYGNPKIKGNDLYDSSQANSEVISDAKSEFSDLVKLGFEKIGITVGESYEDFANNIPMEYLIYPVDDRVDIYSEYSDNIYDKFIKEGKKIHEKFNNINNNENCNSKNNKLFLYDNSCLNIETNTHGGHKCINNKWDMSQCVPSFCDIGFFFNQSSQMCEEECRFDLIKSYFIFEDNYDNT